MPRASLTFVRRLLGRENWTSARFKYNLQ